MALTDYEIKQTSNVSDDNGIFVGERVFAIPRTVLVTEQANFVPKLTNVWPYNDGMDDGIYKPCVDRYEIIHEFPGYPDCARVTCWYRRPTIEKILTMLPLPVHSENTILKNGRAVLETEIRGEAKHPLLKQKIGEARDTEGKRWWTRWAITSGRQYILDPQAELRVRCVVKGVTTTDIGTFCSSWIGRTAGASASPITGITAKNLMCSGIEFGRHPANAALQHLAFVFLYDEDGWEIDCSQAYKPVITWPPTAEVGYTEIIDSTKVEGATIAKGTWNMYDLARLLNEDNW